MQPQTASNLIDPPPYEETLDSDNDSDDEEDVEPGNERLANQPLTLTINTASSIHGCNNLVQTPPPPFAEITKLSTSLLQVIHHITAPDISASATTTSTTQAVKRPRALKVDLTINCGITVIGDRNVIGGIGLRQKGSPAVAPEPGFTAEASVVDAASGGAKRKAEDSPESESEPLVKRAAIET
ncbi:uncharacterized protein RCC_08571 [Ramularia collo-cygni]|uniref:Uncharacterized protein n=1 Tax=Ramularia collo-cygni TaxID=112498 RepID=A0A2D3VB37_9PEZI|nr:uncharacterized protein RCC_08571 [Ramularia collo-cygni]CZT22865.1 uncharacterized protein RCC_08571 [Ramularia collo-cygni]